MNNLDIDKILDDLCKKNIAIIGHMGSGKSKIGKILAKKFNIEHIDTDAEIVRYANLSINEIFEMKGEKFFRKTEEKIISNLITKKNVILSLGGGSILQSKIRKKLIKNSLSLFLDVHLSELKRRLSNSYNRPLLKGVNLTKKIKELDTQRRKYYLLADIKIQNINTTKNSCQTFIKKLTIFHEKKISNKY